MSYNADLLSQNAKWRLDVVSPCMTHNKISFLINCVRMQSKGSLQNKCIMQKREWCKRKKLGREKKGVDFKSIFSATEQTDRRTCISSVMFLHFPWTISAFICLDGVFVTDSDSKMFMVWCLFAVFSVYVSVPSFSSSVRLSPTFNYRRVKHTFLFPESGNYSIIQKQTHHAFCFPPPRQSSILPLSLFLISSRFYVSPHLKYHAETRSQWQETF